MLVEGAGVVPETLGLRVTVEFTTTAPDASRNVRSWKECIVIDF